jgi:hypothetical protein
LIKDCPFAIIIVRRIFVQEEEEKKVENPGAKSEPKEYVMQCLD